MKYKKKPNILIIYTDQQRFDTLSCNVENCPIQTPNIDSIAQNGANFTNCFTQSPICGPSRMSFLTGRYCSSLGVGTNGVAFPESTAVPVHQILKDYGYETAQLGKIHFQPHARRDARMPYPNYGFDRCIVSDEPGCYDDPFTKWVELNAPEQLNGVRTALPPAAFHYGHKTEYSTVPRNTHEPYLFESDSEFTHSAFVTAMTCDYLRERTPNKPFFAISGFYAPHPPINPPKDCVERVDVSKIELPIFVSKDDTMEELKDISKEEWLKIKQYYLAMTVHVDDCVGEIISTLKEIGEYENTIIVFTSDHGEYLGDHGKIQKGMPGYDCCTHVPMIISYNDKVEKNKVFNNLIESVDIVPTLLDWCGIQNPLYIQGKSLVNLFTNKEYLEREDVLCEYFEPYGIRELALRSKKFKYYSNSKGEEMLFDLTEDINELTDVSKDEKYEKILSKMRFRALTRTQNAAFTDLEQDCEY